MGTEHNAEMATESTVECFGNFATRKRQRAQRSTQLTPEGMNKAPHTQERKKVNSVLQQKRAHMRATLDSLSDFSITQSEITFKQSFVLIEAEESFVIAPKCLIDSCRKLLSLDLDDTVPRIVRDNVTIQIGCNSVPLFALVSGGHDRSLFSFRCVYDGCSAFLDIRRFARADKVKWIMVGVSHCHDFSTFPSRIPRNVFKADLIQEFHAMISNGASSFEIERKFNVLCNKHVFQNAVRDARAVARSDQARALRDVANRSNVWNSVIHLDSDNVFVEAFFVNSVLLARRLDVKFVFVDDTSCSNDFGFPVMSVLCRDLTNAVHALGWGVLKNRTTESFVRFFSFLHRFFPSIEIFMCDRHFAQQRGITLAFGSGVHIFHCCVHVARIITGNMGPCSSLARDFWKMRYERTSDAEARFMTTLNKVHNAKKSMFTSHLINSVDSFLPSKVDPFLKQKTLPELEVFHSLDISGSLKQCSAIERVVAIVSIIKSIEIPETVVFTVDNTNTIESYFSMLKRRLQLPTSTVVDVFDAINYIEECVLAAQTRHSRCCRKD